MSQRFVPLTMAMMAMLAPHVAAHAQSTTTDALLAELQARQAEMDARLKIQQDQQALWTGALPATTATPNSGAFTISGTNHFPSQRLAYEQLQKVATDVATAVKANLTAPGPVVIYDQGEINGLVNYKTMLEVLGVLENQVTTAQGTFTTEIHPAVKTLLTFPRAQQMVPAILIPALALASLKTASDLAGMFRTNTNITFTSFTADDAALCAGVANALRPDIQVYLPAAMPLDTFGQPSAFVSRLSSMQSALGSLQASASLDQVQLQHLSDALGAFIESDQASAANQDQINAETDAAKLKVLQAKQAVLDQARNSNRDYVLGLMDGPANYRLTGTTANMWKAKRDTYLKAMATYAASLTAAATALNNFHASLTTVASGGTVPLNALLRSEKLSQEVRKENARVLVVKTSVLGGSVVTRTNLFTGGHLRYTGGAIAHFTLFDPSGAVVTSGMAVRQGETKDEKY